MESCHLVVDGKLGATFTDGFSNFRPGRRLLLIPFRAIESRFFAVVGVLPTLGFAHKNFFCFFSIYE